MYGKLPRNNVDELWKTAHIHLFTSAYEANSTVMFEAMENCVPTIAFNVCGMADLIKENTGIKIEPGKYDDCIKAFSDALLNLANNPDVLMEKALYLREDSFNYAKESRVEFYEEIYKEAINSYEETNK